ncbi:GAF domain-containing protein [Gordonia jinhuaensis]|uniref:Transcriptional regulator n=1 Tax=Gordonia jinhuaensis TaxID=1517702 RepID=A0A916TBA1_9ACTN|nr:GAF domain-containing protein [Gordonia jinhuaensis]GGB37084.1 transcriptional regulator [Gordonia jinhuaensis]
MADTTALGHDEVSGDDRVRAAYERVRADGDAPGADGSAVRSLVWDSWRRSLRSGADPHASKALGGQSLTDTEFAQYRAHHPMTSVRPVVQSLLLDDIADSGVVLALTDEVGRLLWIEGDSGARRRAERINFVEGSLWSEEIVGTNAPGVALALDQSVQIRGPEHFAEPVQKWSCAAAPVHDPATGHVIGVVDVTGGREVSAPFALSAVRLAVTAVENELRSHAIDLARLDSRRPHLSVLGGGLRWTSRAGSTALSRRHAEILLLLSHFREGLSTEALALALAEDGVDPVTVRAEISRLRRDLGTELIGSRPYRLATAIDSDVDELTESIRRRELVDAIGRFGNGGLLATSTAPGVVEMFEEIREDLRSAVIASADANALRLWTESPHGRDDVTAWHRLGSVLPQGHPERALVGGRIRVLDRRFGV